MLITEKEAQNKFCTQSRKKDSFCQAGQCMAFRFIEQADKQAPARGYCGLAGKPLVENIRQTDERKQTMKNNKVTCLVMGSGDPNSDLTWEQMSAFFVVKIAELEQKIEALEAQIGAGKGKKDNPQTKKVSRSLH